MVAPSFYRRPLPDGLIAFSSPEGKQLFASALARGTMEGYFVLSEQFHTQAEPAYCGLGSLVVALNALGVDPGRLWKGPWRWFDESLLDCCVALDVVAARGVTLGELACLAECNGAHSALTRASEAGAADLRSSIAAAARAPHGPIVIASYDRAALDQTGTGHFSPIGGYHEEADLALLLDVARFKYPPHWVPIEKLFGAMLRPDEATGKSRGWVSLTARADPRPFFLRLAVPARGWRVLLEDLEREVAGGGGASVDDWVAALVRLAPMCAEIAEPLAEALKSELAPEHRERNDQILREVRATSAFAMASSMVAEDRGPGGLAPEVIALVAHVLAPEIRTDALGPALGAEVAALRRQLGALCKPRG